MEAGFAARKATALTEATKLPPVFSGSDSNSSYYLSVAKSGA